MAVRNLVLGTGIFIVYVLMLAYGIEAFYSSPEYNGFCKGTGSEKYIRPFDFGNCTFSRTIQEQSDLCYANEGFPDYNYTDAGCVSAIKECNYCSKNFNEASKEHAKIVFFIALIAGIITLLIGYVVLVVEPIGSALIAAGIGAIFYGSVRNWDNLSDVWRFLLLLVALILLIWITVRVNRADNKKRWQFWKK